MKNILIFSFLSFFSLNYIPAQAQIRTVTYEVERNIINNNVPIPSEESFLINGQLPEGILMVQVAVKKSGKNDKSKNIYEWKKAFDFPTSTYELFVSEPLRNNDSYDLEFSFFSRADEDQMEYVSGAIQQNLEAYIRANFEVAPSGIKSNVADAVMISQMNQIVTQGLVDYQHFLGREFQGFSEVIRQKIGQKDRMKLKRANLNILRKNKSNDKSDDSRAIYANQYIDELVAVVHNEIGQYLQNSLFSLVDLRTVANFPTEAKPNSIPINFGYATVPFKRNQPSTEYLHGPALGISIPFGNKTFTKFLGNASFSTGVILTNFESANGESLRGDLIGLPIYAGLGYKVFEVFRLNVGTVMLQGQGFGPTPKKTTYFQPFASISLELNLWLGLKDRR
ncbi:hypothetical protein [Algoriphagus sp.]|uniref:hypothetical protein n=1 Tax=Algoriphagus sp. TaxID=1872435 RepID=UPI003918E149